MERMLFLFAHPDDEIFSIPFWCRTNQESHFVYFTGHKTIREKEILTLWSRFLRNFNVTVRFSPFTHKDSIVSQSISIKDYEWLLGLVDALKIQSIFCLSREGGHQDHDAISVLARAASRSAGIQLFELPAYRNSDYFPGYLVMAPDQETRDLHLNKPILRDRIRYVSISARLMLAYRSQWRTWVGLGIFIFFTYGFKTLLMKSICQTRQHDKISALSMNDYLYQKRKKADPAVEIENLNRFIDDINRN